VTKVKAHRKDAEGAEKKFLYKNLRGLRVSAVNHIKMTGFLKFSALVDKSILSLFTRDLFFEKPDESLGQGRGAAIPVLRKIKIALEVQTIYFECTKFARLKILGNRQRRNNRDTGAAFNPLTDCLGASQFGDNL
jgi:hypothetical protein